MEKIEKMTTCEKQLIELVRSVSPDRRAEALSIAVAMIANCVKEGGATNDKL